METPANDNSLFEGDNGSKECTVCTFPKEYIECLVKKWRRVLNSLLNQDKTANYVEEQIQSITLENQYGVKFEGPIVSYDRRVKNYSIRVSAYRHQDILCEKDFERNDRHSPIFICEKSQSLRAMFIEFFKKVNTVRFCSQCGSYCFDKNYYTQHSMCESCVMNNILATQKTEEKPCAICQESTKRWYSLDCGHCFHRSCLSKINSTPYPRCPLCRKFVYEDDEYLASDSELPN